MAAFIPLDTAAILAQAPANDASTWTIVVIFLIVAIGFIALFLFVFLIKYFNLYVQSVMTGASVRLTDLIGMTFRRVNPNIIVRSKIMAVQAGLTDKEGITTRALEAHYLAGGNVPNVVRALIAANRADIPLSYKRAAAIDLAGRNVLEAIQTSVNPKVIDCPDPAKGRQTVDAVAKDGIQLKAKARVTVRTNIDRLVGGATEETIIARVGEGIVTTIGSADSHKNVLENPDLISKRVLEKALTLGLRLKFFRLISPISMSVTISEPICKPVRPKPTCVWLVPKPKNDALLPSLRSRKWSLWFSRIGRNWSRLKVRSPWPLPMPFAVARLGSWIFTTFVTSRPIQRCVLPLPVGVAQARPEHQPAANPEFCDSRKLKQS